MTKDEVIAIIQEYEAGKAKQPDADWGAEWQEAKEWAEGEGVILGDENGNKQYLAPTTRQMMVLFLYRFWTKVKAYIDKRLGA